MRDAPSDAGEFKALSRDTTMRAFDFSRPDRKPFGDGRAIVQLVPAGGALTMADADRGLVVAHIVSVEVGSPEDLAGAALSLAW